MTRYNIHIIYTLLAALLLSACSGHEDIPLTEPDPRPIVLGYNFDVDLFTSDQPSRDGGTPEPAVNTSATPTLPSTAGVFGAMENYDHAVFDNQKFYHIDDQPYLDDYKTLEDSWDATGYDWSIIANDWPYAPIVAWTIGKNYNFYCYTPHTTYDHTTVDMAYVKYEGMQKFTHSKIPPFSNVAYTVSKSIKTTNSGVVPFDMKHLSARICLCMKIGEQYARLRDIRVKEVTINDRGTDADYFKWEVDLTQNPHTYSWTHDGKYTPTSATSVVNIIPIFKDADGLKLDDKKYQQFGSLYVMPQTVGTLRMNVKYDVYDKSGMLVREDQTISNDVEFFKEVVEGYYYDINIVVSPAYLYVLSDKDVERGVVLLDVTP